MADAAADLGARVVQATRLAVSLHLQEALAAYASDPDVMEWRQRLWRQSLHAAGGAGPTGGRRVLSGAPSADLTDEALSGATTDAAGHAPRVSSLWRAALLAMRGRGRRHFADGGAG